MRYYKNDDFLIIKTDQTSGEFDVQEICTLGLNLLAELEHEASCRSCTCIHSTRGKYAIFPKVPEKLNNDTINFLIDKLQQEGVDFEKEDVDCSAVRLAPVDAGPFGRGFSSVEEFLKEFFGMIDEEDEDENVDEDENEYDEDTTTTTSKHEEGHPIYKICSSVEESLGTAKRLKLENFSVIEYNSKFYLLTVNNLDLKTAKFHKFIYNHFREYFLKEHGVCYYENANYKELESLSFLDRVAIE